MARILILNSNHLNAAREEMMLKRAGHDVSYVIDVDRFLEMCRENPPDAAMINIELEYNGEALQRLGYGPKKRDEGSTAGVCVFEEIRKRGMEMPVGLYNFDILYVDKAKALVDPHSFPPPQFCHTELPSEFVSAVYNLLPANGPVRVETISDRKSNFPNSSPLLA